MVSMAFSPSILYKISLLKLAHNKTRTRLTSPLIGYYNGGKFEMDLSDWLPTVKRFNSV